MKNYITNIVFYIRLSDFLKVKPESYHFAVSVLDRITRCILILLLLFLGYTSTICQRITQYVPVNKGDTIIINYNLEGLVKFQVFEVKVYTSFNRSYPIHCASGDIVPNIKFGQNHKIYWNAKKELDGFKGDIRIYLEATVELTPFENVKISRTKKLIMGKTYKLTWEGSEKDKEVMV
jgi:hypothetical protein